MICARLCTSEYSTRKDTCPKFESQSVADLSNRWVSAASLLLLDLLLTPPPSTDPPPLDSTRAPFCPQYLQFKNTQAQGWLPGFTSYVIQENELFRPQARLPMSLNSLVVTRRWHIVVFHLAGVDLPAVPTPHRGEALNSGHCTIARQLFKGGPLQANH